MDMNIVELLKHARTPVVMQATEGSSGPFAFVPDGYKRESLESMLIAPVRKRAAVTMNDTDSFIAYINKHIGFDPAIVVAEIASPPANCALYADANFEAQTIQIIGLLDDHGGADDDAKWRDHTAKYIPKTTVEWQRWNLMDGKRMSQQDFAEFIEENLPDIAALEGMPTGTDMLKMATLFEMNSTKRFKSALNLQSSGVALTFIDEADSATETQMSMFKRFTLGLRVFIGGAAYPLEARLKFKNTNGVLTFWYELIRPDRVFATAVTEELAKIKNETGCLLMNGNPGTLTA